MIDALQTGVNASNALNISGIESEELKMLLRGLGCTCRCCCGVLSSSVTGCHSAASTSCSVVVRSEQS
jgi:hypothetical protein